MNRNFRIRRYDKLNDQFDTLFPQTVTANILRRDNGGVLEQYLASYDQHVDSGSFHLNHAVGTGTSHRVLEAHIHNKPLEDGFPLILTVNTEVDASPKLNYNGTGEKPIVDNNGEPIVGGQMPGNLMFLIWNQNLDSWVMLSNNSASDVIKVFMPTMREYVYEAKESGEQLIPIPGFNANHGMLQINYGQTVLRHGLDYEFSYGHPDTVRLLFTLEPGDILYFRITEYEMLAKHGNVSYELRVEDHVVNVEDGQTEVIIPNDALGANYLELNYGQTILREGLDYTLNSTKDRITVNFAFYEGTPLVIRAMKMAETNGLVYPDRISPTGNYRYSLKILHETYEATTNNVTLVPIPKFDRKTDDVIVVKDNLVLMLDVDYTIDSMNQLVLLRDALKVGDELHFTITQGAALGDIPQIAVIDASGTSGQHLLFDLSYEVLHDKYVLIVKLAYDLEPAPTGKCIDGPAEPIVDPFGSPVLEGYKAGSFLWLGYNESQHLWYSLSHGSLDVTARYPVTTVNKGTANFSGNIPRELFYGDDPDTAHVETVIEHHLGAEPQVIDVHPCEPPNKDDNGDTTTIGDIWTYADATYLYVGNSGNATSKFTWSVSTNRLNTDMPSYVDDNVNYINNRIHNITDTIGTLDAKVDTSEAHTREYVDTTANVIRGNIAANVAMLKARAGNFYNRPVAITIMEDFTRTFTIPEFNTAEDKVYLVNFGQTVLREDLDYTISGDTVTLNNIDLMAGDIIQLMIVKQPND